MFFRVHRLQNLGTKIIHSLNNNQMILAKKTFDEFREQFKESAPEFYAETANINF